MTMVRYCYFLLFLALVSWASEGFFALPQRDKGAELPKELVYPRGRIVPILGYAPRTLEQMKESGFTVAGPTYSKTGDAWIGKYPGYPVVYSIAGAMNGILCTKELFNQKVKLDFDAIGKDVASKVRKAVEQYPNIAFFYISPEERRWWRKGEYQYVECLYKAIRENDPEKRPVFMYLPGHYDANSVAKYADRLDVLGKGTYVNYSGYKKERVWVRYSIECLKQAASSSKEPKVILPVLEMFVAPPKEELSLVSAWARHDAYLSMVSGAHGFGIFSLHNRKGVRAAYKAYYDAYRQVALELTSPEHGLLGEVFLFGEWRDDLRLEVLNGPKELRLHKKGAGAQKGEGTELSYPPVAHASIAHPRGRFLFMVNSANEAVECRITGLPEETIAIRSATTGELMGQANGSLSLTFAPYEVKLLKLEQIAKEAK